VVSFLLAFPPKPFIFPLLFHSCYMSLLPHTPLIRRTYKNCLLFSCIWSPGSSVTIVYGYGLDDRAIEVRSPAEAKRFFVYPLCPDRLWGPPSLLYNGYRGSFPRG
jgi:hypothetical protein